MFRNFLLCYLTTVSVLFQVTNAQEKEDCIFVGTTSRLVVTLKDVHNIKESVDCTVDGATKLADGKHTCNKYFEITKSQDKLTFTVNEKYHKIEEDIFNKIPIEGITRSEPSRVAEHHFVLNGTCQVDDLSLETSYDIIDENNHKPIFEQISTSYTIPIPLMPGYDITKNSPLYVYDMDLTTKDIKIDIKEENGTYFKAKTIDNEPNTSFIIYNLKPWVENKPFHLTLHASDQDGVESEKTMEIDVTIDKDNSLDKPQFDERTIELTSSDGTVNAEITYKSKKEVNLTKFGNDEKLFEVKNDDKNKKLQLTASKLPDQELFTLGVTITSDYSDTCMIIVRSKTQSELKFDNKYYLANYTVKNQFELENDINILTSLDEFDVKVDDKDLAEYFEITWKDKSVQIDVKKGKDLHDLATNLINVPLKVENKDKTLSDTTNLIISVISKEDDTKLHFDKSIYGANYNVTNDIEKPILKVDEIKIIGLKNGQTVKPTIEADCEGCEFEVTEEKSNTFTISVKKALSEDFLEKNRHLVGKLKATLTDDDTTFCEAVINIYLEEIKGPSFSFDLYKATYNLTDHKLLYSDAISINKVGNEDPIPIIDTPDYKDKLILERKDNDWFLKATDKPIEKTESLSVLISISAKEKEYLKTAEAKIFLSLVQGDKIVENKFQFKKSLYHANYKIEGNDLTKASVDLIDTFDFDGIKTDETVDIKILNSDLTVDIEDSKYVIKVTKPLDLDTLAKNKKIVYILQANDSDADKCEAALELSLQQFSGPKFTKNVFQAVYNTSTEKLENAETITIENMGQKKNVHVTIESKYEKSLAVEQSDKDFKLNLKSPLSLDDNDEKLILIKMEVIEDNWFKSEDNTASIALQIVDKDTPIEKLAFVKSLHKIDYKVDKNNGQITITGEDIELKNVWDPEKVTFKLNTDYESSFSIEYDSDKAVWKVKQGHDQLPLSKITINPLVIKIVATEENYSTESVLSVSLPEKKENNNDDDKGGNNTALIAIVAVLAVLLIGYIVGTAIFYVLKIRKQIQKDPDIEMEEYIKNRNLTSQPKQQAQSVSARRPTGMVFGRPIDDEDDDDDDQGDTNAGSSSEDKERRKSVVFNENVEEMKIDTTSLNENNGGDTASEKSLEKDD